MSISHVPCLTSTYNGRVCGEVLVKITFKVEHFGSCQTKWSYGSTRSQIYIRHYVQLHRLWYVSQAITVALSAGLNTQYHIVTAKLSNILNPPFGRCWLPLFFHQTFLYDETVLHQKTYRSHSSKDLVLHFDQRCEKKDFILRLQTARWAPTSCKWSYNSYKWPKING